MTYQDRILKCAECGQDFVFFSGEQQFYADKGFKNEPKRCSVCRAKSKTNGNKVGPVHTETTCSQCGKRTVVPFVPTQGKPVFCRGCMPRRGAVAQPERI